MFGKINKWRQLFPPEHDCFSKELNRHYLLNLSEGKHRVEEEYASLLNDMEVRHGVAKDSLMRSRSSTATITLTYLVQRFFSLTLK